jgi:hypothetical protein
MTELFAPSLADQKKQVRAQRRARLKAELAGIPASCHPHRPACVKKTTLCRPCYDALRFAKRPELGKRKRARQAKYYHQYYKDHRNKILHSKREKYADQDISWRRQTSLKQRYGLTLEDYDNLLQLQNGVCAICGRPPRGKTKGRRLYVDHDQTTGRVRGLLCPSCNTTLGQFNHDPAVLLAAINYLRRELPNGD